MKYQLKCRNELEDELKNLYLQYNELQASFSIMEERESQYRELLDSLKEVIFEIDMECKLRFCNQRAYEFFGYQDGGDYVGFEVMDYIVPEDRPRIMEAMERLFRTNKTSVNEYMAMRKDGQRFPIVIHAVPIFRNNQPFGVRGVMMDVSQRKKLDEKIIFLSQFDTLTRLYNRYYFESQIESYDYMPCKKIGIVVCDVDGLKLINDTMGHQAGDNLLKTAADILKAVFSQDYLVARIGGDEFAVLSTNTNKEMLAQFCHVLKDKINSYNSLNPGSMLSISVGYAVQNENSIKEVFKQADNNMYREKLHCSQSVRSYMIKTLLKTLEERDIITEQHTERLCWLVEKFALAVGLTETAINELGLFARFHDIGKVGIPDSILFKTGPLLPREILEMQRHCEIGQRIALSSPDLIPISDWILKHHEWWNGQGYPLGINGMEIPLECRLLKIVDSYDAMTNDRPYRKALSHQQALSELKRFSGIQTDPYLTEKFLTTIEDNRTCYTIRT